MINGLRAIQGDSFLFNKMRSGAKLTAKQEKQVIGMWKDSGRGVTAFEDDKGVTPGSIRALAAKHEH